MSDGWHCSLVVHRQFEIKGTKIYIARSDSIIFVIVLKLITSTFNTISLSQRMNKLCVIIPYK